MDQFGSFYGLLGFCAAYGLGLVVEYVFAPESRVVFLIAGFIILCACGFYIVGKMRENLRETDANPSDFMTNFRELHATGQLSDEEYRTIKAKLAARLREKFQEETPVEFEEIKDTDREG